MRTSERSVKICIIDILDCPTLDNVSDFMSLAKDGEVEFIIRNPINGQTLDDLDHTSVDGIVILGSFHPYDSELLWKNKVQELVVRTRSDFEIPLLAICMTHELVAKIYGGEVSLREQRELGTIEVDVLNRKEDFGLFDNLPDSFFVHTLHKREVSKLPEDAIILGVNKEGVVQSYRMDNIFGVQFHLDIKRETFISWLSMPENVHFLISDIRIKVAEEAQKYCELTFLPIETSQIICKNFIKICRKNQNSKLFVS